MAYGRLVKQGRGWRASAEFGNSLLPERTEKAGGALSLECQSGELLEYVSYQWSRKANHSLTWKKGLKYQLSEQIRPYNPIEFSLRKRFSSWLSIEATCQDVAGDASSVCIALG